MVTNLYVCRYTSNQAKCVSYFRLKNVVGPKNMRQASLPVVLTYLFYVIITLVPVFTVSLVHGQLERTWRFWQPLTFNYGTKVRSNKKILPFYLGRSKYLESTKSAKGLLIL